MFVDFQPFIETQLNTFAGRPVKLGIDEAGRGPVLGHLSYACFYCPEENEKLLAELKVDDSKKLTEEMRGQMYCSIREHSNDFGYMVHALSPEELSGKMLMKAKYNLNEISHDTAISLIHRTQAAGVNVTEVYVDTVGRAEAYQQKLQKKFPSISVTVAEKADSLFPVVSAASICAKVVRDRLLKQWKFVEASDCSDVQFSTHFGTGYPGDPVTKAFLTQSLDKVFGFPSIVRFSWATAKDKLENQAYSVNWYETGDEAGDSGASSRGNATNHQASIKSFFGVSSSAAVRCSSQKTEMSGSVANKDTPSTRAFTKTVQAVPRNMRFYARTRMQAVTEFV